MSLGIGNWLKERKKIEGKIRIGSGTVLIYIETMTDFKLKGSSS
jgi:hypothetical protein